MDDLQHRREYGVRHPDGTVQLCDDEPEARLRAGENGTVIARDVLTITWTA